MYDKKQLAPYIDQGMEVIPLWPWNKMKQGKERGKTPIHNEWNTNKYPQAEIPGWITKGLNLGVRIKENELIMDLDPRNYVEGIDSPQLAAELLGYFDFEEILWECPVVKTGGGGYHVYFRLPADTNYKLIRSKIKAIPGVDFKKKGGYVVAAGSKHPNGEFYKWENIESPVILTEKQLEPLLREEIERDFTSGYGALNGTQLQELILDKLDIAEYSTNDDWFPIMCAAHHVTGGDGIEEFLEWSMGDPDYADDENVIRNRWESLHATADYMNTVGTLIHELKQRGEDITNVQAVLTFSEAGILEGDDEDTEEFALLGEAKKAAQEIGFSDIYKGANESEKEDLGVQGKALEAINNLPPEPSSEDVAKCLRLIKAADPYEGAMATDALSKATKLSKATITQLLKQMEAKLSDDLALLICRKTLEITFNGGKHLSCPPSGILFTYRKTHWIRISDEFMGKIVQNTLHQLKEKMEVKANELSLIQQAVKLCRIHAATLRDKLHSTDLPPSVINCRNGELWIENDGTHKLRPHNYRSYLQSCLSVDYQPGAQCPLFMETLRGIFRDFPDTEELVRHMGEIMGYAAQPYKNIPSWWLFRGPGGDGKSTILQILEAILGKGQLMTSVKLLGAASAESGSEHAFSDLVGRTCVVVEELPAGYMLRDATMKMLSANTKMSANPKFKDQFDFMYAGTLIMCSNGYPAIRDMSHGMMRRANIIPFNRQFDQTGKEDLNRLHKIIRNEEEMSGILNFMLEGLERLRNRGRFLPPESCMAAKEEWSGEANSVIRFVKETIDVTSKARGYKDIVCSLSELYDIHYRTWCDENDIDEKLRKRKSQFKRDLNSLGLNVTMGGAKQLKVYGGILKEGGFLDGEEDDF